MVTGILDFALPRLSFSPRIVSFPSHFHFVANGLARADSSRFLCSVSFFFEDTHRQTNYGKARTSAIANAPLSCLLYISNTPLSRVKSKVWVFVTNKNKMSNYVGLAWDDSWGFLCSVSFLLKIVMHFLSCMTRDRNYGKARTSAIANAPLSRLLCISNSPLSRVKSKVCVFVTNKKLDQDE